MIYSEILAAFEFGELEPMAAFELAGCYDIIELYELASDEADGLQHSRCQKLAKNDPK